MSNTSHSLISYLRTVIGSYRDDSRDDTELLAQFAENGDDVAFQVVVWRHGPMVWQTCRRLLTDTPDIEDAFQTTFLALARKAKQSSFKNPAGWLHRVARRIALDADSKARRRREFERRVQTEAPPEAKESPQPDDTYALLDEELANLPERLRVTLVLRHLEGKTLAEVARMVGCSLTAVTKRLARGEEILRKQLIKRGLGIATVAALLTKPGKAPAVPAHLIGCTSRAAVAFRAGILNCGSAAAAQRLLRALVIERVVRASWWLAWVSVCCLGAGRTGLMAWKMWVNSPDTVMPKAPDTTSPKTAVQRGNLRVDCYGDPLPDGALARIGTIRFRPVLATSIAFLPDDKTLVSISEIEGRNSLHFWEWRTGKELRRLDGVRGAIVAVSPDGKMLAVGGEYWDLTMDPPERLQRAKLISLMPLGDVAFSPDSKVVAWAGEEKKGNKIHKVVYLVDASTGKVKRRLEDADGQHLAFSRDGKTLAIGGGEINIPENGELALWDAETGTKRLQIARNDSAISFLAFLPDGRTLLESKLNTRSKLDMYNLDTDGWERMRLLSAATGTEQQPPDGNYMSRPFYWRDARKCLSPNGKLLGVLSRGGKCKVISVWDRTTGREVGPVGGIHFPVGKLAFSPDGKFLASMSGMEVPRYFGTPEFQVWESETGRLKAELALRQNFLDIPSIGCSNDGHHLEMFCASGRRLEIIEGSRKAAQDFEGPWSLLQWNSETDKINEVKKKVPADVDPLLKRAVRCCAISSDGRWQALGLTNGITILDRATGKEVRRFQGAIRSPGFVAFAWDGQSILTSSDFYQDDDRQFHRLEVWSVATGKIRVSLRDEELESDTCSMNTLSPDGRYLAVAKKSEINGPFIQVIEVASGMPIGEIKISEMQWTNVVAWSPDECTLAIGGIGLNSVDTVWLWDMKSWREIRHFIGHRDEVRALVFSSDGQRLASGSDDATALIWDLHDLSRQELKIEALHLAFKLWTSLGEKASTDLYRTIYLLAQNPDLALPLLRERLRPASTPVFDVKRVDFLLARLDNDDFHIRKDAEEQLAKMGEGIALVLQQALAKKLSLEVRQRINNLLIKINGSVCPSGLNMKEVQACRAVEVLERIGTPVARQVLEELARLPEGSIQAEEAKAALNRLRKPASVPAS